jgi:hypothetical protein
MRPTLFGFDGTWSGGAQATLFPRPHRSTGNAWGRDEFNDTGIIITLGKQRTVRSDTVVHIPEDYRLIYGRSSPLISSNT